MSDTEEKKEDDTSVRVAIRIRPQNAREKIDMCQVCTTLTDDGKQVQMGKDKAFTFDYVFDIPTQQDHIYNSCIRHLIEGCFEGYNATVFAYGQTGSGKTYTMGTGFESTIGEITDEIGIIPRAVDHLFMGIDERRRQAFENGEPAPEFKVTAQFMELYNEEILDLLDTTRDPEQRGRKSHNRIHEDASGGIYVVGITSKPVASLHETIQCLKSGALSRATASTNMNAQSSRSHAIFTIHVRQHRVVKDNSEVLEEVKETDSTQAEFETLTAKFHFVDLAGSERLKRTGATGDRAKEGISINCGLLALGNVISALGDQLKKGSHVPYRDSKLTRLLQDSLGGNSRTLMIACVSPSDRDFMETLNTLKYANRARNIKNKVMANQDKASRQLALLRQEIAALQQELNEYKTGRRTIDEDGVECVNDMVAETSMLQTENDKLRQRIKAMQDTVESLQTRNAHLMSQAELASVLGSDGQVSNEDVSNLVKKYVQEIEVLKSKLAESESMCEHISKAATSRASRTSSSRMSMSSMSMTGSMIDSMAGFAGGMEAPASPVFSDVSVLAEAKKEMKRLRKLKRGQSRSHNHESDKENIDSGDILNRDIGMEDSMEVSTTSLDTFTEQNRDVNGDDIDDEEDDDDDSLSDSSSDSELEDKDSDNVHEDLYNLTCEINIKQKLIEELEQTQKKMNSIKVHYEDKVHQLQQKIKETEMERDKILSNIDKMSNSSSESSKKVKQDYEKKLGGLKDELKKMQIEQRKTAKIQKNNSQYERNLKTLQHELTEMKKAKVKLMKQVKEEVDKNKQNEARRTKEMSQLRKEQLRRDNIIKTLERQTLQKDAVLKRKQEEMEALRKKQKPMSSKAAGRVGKYEKAPTVPRAPLSSMRRKRKVEFSPKAAKSKWDSIEKNISSVITKRQTITMLERDMDVWLKQREKCTKELEKYEKKKKDALNSNQPEEVIRKLSRTIEGLSLKVEDAQENINECQSNIMQMEEAKDDGDGSTEVSSMMESMSLEEAKYMIEKLYHRSLDKGVLVSQKDSEVKELQGRLHQTELNNALQQDLLRHMMDGQVNLEVDDLMTRNDELDDAESTSSSSSSSPAESMLDSAMGPPSPGIVPSMETLSRREKARRKTATTQDMLYATGGDPAPSLLPVLELPQERLSPALTSSGRITPPNLPPSPGTSLQNSHSISNGVGERNGEVQGSTVHHNNDVKGGDRGGAGDGSEKLLMPPPRVAHKPKSIIPRPSPIMRRRELVEQSPVLPRRGLSSESSPVMTRRGLSRSNSMGAGDISDSSPPSSPTVTRRSFPKSSEENVFSRLTSNTVNTSPQPNRGEIVPASSSRPSSLNKSLLTCTYTAEGHTKAVLSVCATDHLLFTGSKDRTAKTWDLSTGKEVTSFPGHPNNVLKVSFCPRTQLVFTVSQSSIRVWDMRKSSDPCIKTLSSSGLTTSGSASFSAARQTEAIYRDHQINDIQVSRDCNTLFCAAGNVVQIWDMRRFSQAGRLSGHQAPVMAIALDAEGGHTQVISGSKDHYIKIFEVIDDAAGILTPKFNLEPPHYDGIQSLALRGHTLFSGSRDMCIKKWDLTTQQHKHSINAAHKDWVCALDFVPGTNLLLSGCRGGYLKIWQPDTCTALGEIRAHGSPINAIATNSSDIFTASNDCVGIWRPRPSLDSSTSTDTTEGSEDCITSS